MQRAHDEKSMFCVANVKLSDGVFDSALKRYVDATKPDRLAQQQLENLTLHWSGGADIVDGATPVNLEFSPTHALHGCLSLVGQQIRVEIQSQCYWMFGDDDNDIIWLYFQMMVSARPRTTSLMEDGVHDDNKSSSQDGTTEATRTKLAEDMRTRLENEPLIRRLLVSAETTPKLFCEASIHNTKNNLEERVDVSEDVAEGVRLAVLSQLETSLDVVEFLLSMPLLPTTSHKDCVEWTTRLADRAKLRLLEDAMFDACEKEGEDEILDNLSISQKGPNIPISSGEGDKQNNIRPTKKKKMM